MSRKPHRCAEECIHHYLRSLWDPSTAVTSDRVPANTFTAADFHVPSNDYTRAAGIAGGRILMASCRAPRSPEGDCSCHAVVDVGGRCLPCESTPQRCFPIKLARFTAARAYKVAGRWEDWMAGRYGRRF